MYGPALSVVMFYLVVCVCMLLRGSVHKEAKPILYFGYLGVGKVLYRGHVGGSCMVGVAGTRL